jgi:hypothetical protein
VAIKWFRWLRSSAVKRTRYLSAMRISFAAAAEEIVGKTCQISCGGLLVVHHI